MRRRRWCASRPDARAQKGADMAKNGGVDEVQTVSDPYPEGAEDVAMD